MPRASQWKPEPSQHDARKPTVRERTMVHNTPQFVVCGIADNDRQWQWLAITLHPYCHICFCLHPTVIKVLYFVVSDMVEFVLVGFHRFVCSGHLNICYLYVTRPLSCVHTHISIIIAETHIAIYADLLT